MVTAMRNRPHLLIVGAVASMALVGVAAVVGLGPSRSTEKPEAASAKESDAGPRRALGATCANCGTVEAIRTVTVAADGAKRTVYRITVRMDDGSFRTLSQATPPSVAVGEAVRITDGAVVRPPSQDTKG
jgi:L-serine deaminase